MRRAAKVDASQPDIVAALRAAGARVLVLSVFGVSVDLLVYYKARYWLLECKNPGPPSSQKLTEREKDLAALFPIFVVTTPAEALDRIGVDLAA